VLCSPWWCMRLIRRFIAILCVVAACFPALAGTLSLEVLDVGQGDAIVIRTPADKIVLVDAGDDPHQALTLLRERKVDHIDLAVATHPHADHIGGMIDVVEHIPVKLFVDNGLPHTTATYRKLMQAIERRGIAYRVAVAGTTYRLDDGATLEILFPRGEALHGTRSDLNANSVVLRLRHLGHCFLLAGDAEEPTERALVASGLGPCEVLKVAHHGSEYSSSDAFLAAVQPRYALISVGGDNDYGHPGAHTLAHLSSLGAVIHRTDLEGSLVVLSSENSLQIKGTRIDAGRNSPVLPIHAPPPTSKIDTHPVNDRAVSATCAFVASAKGEVFHDAICGSAGKIKPSNVRCFPSREAALAAGLRPAGCCKP
jgi:competence protein ComEC